MSCHAGTLALYNRPVCWACLPSSLKLATCKQPCWAGMAALNFWLAGLESEEAQQQHFLRIWNLKEAFCKAQGLGIISTMRHHTFSISRAPDELPGQLGLEADPCRLRASNGKAGQIMQSCMDNQPAWQVKLQPSCDHAYFSVFDVNQAHTAAVCLLGPQGSLPVDTFAAAPIIKHFWPHENTAYLQTLRPGRQITGLRRL